MSVNVQDCIIVSKEVLQGKQVILGLKSKDISETCRSGQFVNIACDALLRRPISICGTDQEQDIFYIGIRVKGSGTQWLFDRVEGEHLSVVGPLGNHFKIPESNKCLVVGGGIGVFPLLFLLQEIKENHNPTLSVCGFRSKEESICTEKIRTLSEETIFASECGDLDVCGNVSDAMKNIDCTNTQIFTCGPYPMMKYVSSLAASHNVSCQVSLEERMGCGTGVCLVCACKIKAIEDPEGYEYKRCCKEGPVFDASEVVWE